MSVVVDSRKLPLLVWTAFNYAQMFHDRVLVERRVRQAIVDPFDLEMDEILEEEWQVMTNWMDSLDDNYRFPPMKRHFMPTSARRELAKEWPPPAIWVKKNKVIASLALPQTPQQRVRIPDPTDRFGKKRSIRVHFAENR